MLGYENMTKAQNELCEWEKLFISLPTNSGKSLCYAILPLLFDKLRGCVSSRSILVVVLPLVTLMQDQVTVFTNKGLKCRGEKEKVLCVVERGEFQLSPESLINISRWFEMLRSKKYQMIFYIQYTCIVVDEAHLMEKW